MKVSLNRITSRFLDVLVLVVVVVAISVMLVGYLRFIQAEEQKRVDQVVRESAIQSVMLIREHLSNNMAYIERIGCFLGQSDLPITSTETLQQIQGDAKAQQTFKNVTIATADGTLYGVDGKAVGNIANHDHFKAAMAGNTVISDMEQSLSDHKNIIYVTAPIERDGKRIGIVNGRFLMSSLSEILSVESFDGQGYSYMANADGHIFVRSNNPNVSPDFTNIYESFESASAVSDQVLRQMRQNMQEGKTGRISYEWNGDKRTMNYTPVGINGWYFLSVIPNEIVTSRAMALTQHALVLAGALLVVLFLFIFYINRARRKDQEELAAVHEELLTIYNTIPGGVFKCRLDDSFTLVGANAGFYRFVGYTQEMLEEKFSNQLVQLMQPEDIERVKESLAKQWKTGESTRDEVRFVGADGSEKWLLLCGDILQNQEGEVLVYCCFTDISELRAVQEELRRAKHRYDLIAEETQEIIFEWDPIKHTIYHSKIFEKKFGYPCTLENFPESIFTHHLVPEEDEERCLGVYRRIEEGSHFSTGEFRIKKVDGSFLWCRVSMTAVLDDENRLCRVVGVIADIDHVKNELKEATERAQRDSMTGLYNKATTVQLIEQRLGIPISCAALLMVDIDNFKEVNDTLGHASGDLVLGEVSKQLRYFFRVTDIVGRVGGDEFMVLADGLAEGDDLERKLLDISEVLRWSFRKNNLACFMSCSIGVALYPRDGHTYAQLSQRADAALYFAKQNGKNRFVIYSEGMQSTIHGVEDEALLRGNAPDENEK